MKRCSLLAGGWLRAVLTPSIACVVLALGCSNPRAVSHQARPRDAGLDANHASRPAPTAPMIKPDVSDPGPIIAEPDDPATYIYDQAQLRTYELLLAPEALARIDADPRAEEYVEGILRFEGRDYGPVGIRYKGSVGAFRTCVDATTGAKICTKLSMKVSFNWKDPKGTFYGLRKLQFHAMNRDPSMLKERLGYGLFRESELAAPRVAHARLRINGQLAGLFALVEEVDGRFTRSRFSEGGKGNLYKEGWPLDADNHAITDEALRPQLQTNEDEQPALDTMLDFGRALEQADGAALTDALASFTDPAYSMRYVAVDRTIAHDDGPFHWYCLGTACFNHNYYWYEEQRSDRLWIVTWDLDSAFNLDNPITTLWLEWDDTSLGCEAMSQAPFVLPLRAPSCDKLTLGWAQQQRRYLTEVQAFLDGPFEAARVESKLRAWEAQIEPVVAEAAALHTDALSVPAWHDAAAALRSAIATLRRRAEDRIARPEVVDAGAKDAGAKDASPDDGTEDAGEDPDLDAGR